MSLRLIKKLLSGTVGLEKKVVCEKMELVEAMVVDSSKRLVRDEKLEIEERQYARELVWIELIVDVLEAWRVERKIVENSKKELIVLACVVEFASTSCWIPSPDCVEIYWTLVLNTVLGAYALLREDGRRIVITL